MGSSSTMRTRKPMGKLSVFELLSAIDEMSALGDGRWALVEEGESEGETECVDVAVVVIVVIPSFFFFVLRVLLQFTKVKGKTLCFSHDFFSSFTVVCYNLLKTEKGGKKSPAC